MWPLLHSCGLFLATNDTIAHHSNAVRYRNAAE